MIQKKAIRKPSLARGCGSCVYKDGEPWVDTVDPNITRIYCRARHVNVDVELMSRECDFYKLSPDYEVTDKDKNNRFGL